MFHTESRQRLHPAMVMDAPRTAAYPAAQLAGRQLRLGYLIDHRNIARCPLRGEGFELSIQG